MKIRLTKKRIILFTSLLLLLSIILFTFLNKSSQIPKPYIGNWINEQENEWVYGFYEEFAVYDCDFWDYDSVSEENEQQVHITLRKGSERLKLHLTRLDDNQLTIQSDDGGEERFVRMDKVYPAYPKADSSFFPTPEFKFDSVTIVGYYRNLDKGIKGFSQRFFPSPFEVTISNFLVQDELKYYADIDKKGRFKITFPVMNTQELYIDWKRTRIKTIVEPGDVLFLFANIEDYLLSFDDMLSYDAYVDRPKEVLFMGEHARANNEIRQYTNPRISVGGDSKEITDDMEYLHKSVNAYNQRIGVFEKHLEDYPTASEKFKYYKRTEERLDLGFSLLQRAYDIAGREKPYFHEDYLAYIKENFPMDKELDYTLTRNVRSILNDYMFYMHSISEKRNAPVYFTEIGRRLDEEGLLSEDIKQQIDELNEQEEAYKLLDDKENKETLLAEINARCDQLNTIELVRTTASTIQDERSFFYSNLGDSIIANQHLLELWTTSCYVYWFEVIKRPLSSYQQTVFKEKIKNPSLVAYIDRTQRDLEKTVEEGKVYNTSFKNTEHLKEHKEAKQLFEELIEPYKGKVIYVDFWGTWCGACRRDMKEAHAVKEAFKDEPVIFMYLANRSAEDSWKNFINELGLTGENIVHYRLPDEQQGMIERLFSVMNFPTYMLIDQEGKVVDTNAARPTNLEALSKQINDLL